MQPMNDEMPPAGMIEEAMPPEGAPPGEPPPPDEPPRGAVEDEEGGSDGLALADQVIEQLEAHIPPELQSAVERLVLAGKRAMFSPEMNELALKQVESDPKGPVSGAATGVAALMSQLTMRSKGQMPAPAIVPAALILLMESLKFLAEAGRIELNAQTIEQATTDLSAYLMQKLGLSPEKVAEAQEALRSGGAAPQGGPMPPGEADPGMPPAAAPGPQEPPSGGLVNRMMRG